MARERTADDLVLALLARSAVPLGRAQIAESLGWEKSMVSKVLARLQDRLEVTPGATTGATGRPSAKFSLKQPETAKAGMPPPLRYETDTYVLTPSNRVARVLLHRRDGWVEIEFLDGPRSTARTTLHASYLKPFQHGRERPAPVQKG